MEAPEEEEELFTVHLLSKADGALWSWHPGGSEARLDSTLTYFAWPPSLGEHRPVAHAFSTTDSRGSRAFDSISSLKSDAGL